LDGTRIRSKEYEKDLVEAKKRKIEKDKQVINLYKIFIVFLILGSD